MRDERASQTGQPPRSDTQSHRIVRYLIGGWNTALGAILALGGLATSDVEYTALAAIAIVLGVGMLVGKRWAWALATIMTALTAIFSALGGTSYGYSVAIVQGVLFAGLLYAAPAFSQPRDG